MNNKFILSSVSFFCPAYNDAGNLPNLIPVVCDFLTNNSEKFEIIIIDQTLWGCKFDRSLPCSKNHLFMERRPLRFVY
jgi:hypothetical protein